MFFGEPVNIVPETMGIVWGYAFECKKLNDTNQTPVKKFGGGNVIMALHKTYDACVFVSQMLLALQSIHKYSPNSTCLNCG